MMIDAIKPHQTKGLLMTNALNETMTYIDDAARRIANTDAEVNASEDYPGWAADDTPTFWEIFSDAIESASAGAPAEVIPQGLSDDDELANIHLLYDLIAARLYQLIFCNALTEGN